MTKGQAPAVPARQVPLIAWEELRGVDPDGIEGLLERWQGPTIPVREEWKGQFATEALEMEVGDFVGHLAILVIAPDDRQPADSKIYLVQPPAGPLSVAVFRETDYVAMFDLASAPHDHRAVPGAQCTVIGRVTYLIAPL